MASLGNSIIFGLVVVTMSYLEYVRTLATGYDTHADIREVPIESRALTKLDDAWKDCDSFIWHTHVGIGIRIGRFVANVMQVRCSGRDVDVPHWAATSNNTGLVGNHFPASLRWSDLNGLLGFPLFLPSSIYI